jgi:PQQ-like domain
VSWGKRNVAVAALLAVAGTGCWPSPGAGPDRRSVNGFETAITVATAPTLRQGWAVTPGEGELGSPVVSGAGVHVNDPLHLYGIDKATGDLRWTFAPPPLPEPEPGTPPPFRWAVGQPVVDGDRLLASTVLSPFSPFFFAGSVAVDTVTGEQVGELDGAAEGTLRGRRTLVRQHNIAEELFVAAVNVDDPASDLMRMSVDDTAALDDPALIPSTLGAQRLYHAGEGVATTTRDDAASLVVAVRAFAPGAGTCKQVGDFFVKSLSCPSWVTVLDGAPATSPVLAEDESTVYVGSDAGTVYALDAATGAVQWSTGVGSAVSADPAVDAQRLYVPTAGGDLVALERSGGAVAFTAAVGPSLTVQPAVAGETGGVVFTGASDGTVSAFAAAGCGTPTCGPLWEADAGGAVTGAPAVSGGQVYVGTAEGRLVAYRPA